MKKIILTLSGVLFVIVTGCSLLICMMNGIPNLDQPAAAFYLAKAILLSFSLPLVTLGLFVHCLQLRRKLDKNPECDEGADKKSPDQLQGFWRF